jgi:hypothetical protein
MAEEIRSISAGSMGKQGYLIQLAQEVQWDGCLPCKGTQGTPGGKSET